MRFEKLNENKIRITITNKDLEDKHIDTHSFMANPIESQTLFLDMLNKAEQEIGFVTKNYNIKIEALQVSGGDFVITITRSIPESFTPFKNTSDVKKNIQVKRKNLDTSETDLIYTFNSFDDFCDFSNVLIKNNININLIAKNILLYEYIDEYYLVFSKIYSKNLEVKKIFSLISEFATYVNNSKLFKCKLIENGKLLIKNNAIKTAVRYF